MSLKWALNETPVGSTKLNRVCIIKQTQAEIDAIPDADLFVGQFIYRTGDKTLLKVRQITPSRIFDIVMDEQLKNTANGYAGLDAGAKVLLAQLTEVIALDNLSDVIIAAPAEGEVVTYEAATSKFKNKTAASSKAFLGNGSDGEVTISTNTDLGSANKKRYNNLTINAGIILQGNSGMVIAVKATLTFGSATSTIHVDRKGSVGGAGSAGGAGADGTNAKILGTLTNTKGIGGTTGQGGGGGALGGDGGRGGNTGGLGGSANGIPVMAQVSGGGAGGGGGGAGQASNTGGTGGTGGGILYVFANAISGTGIISADGNVGGDGSGSPGTSGHGGGGGGGGFALVGCYGAIPAITVRARGGAGGAGQSTGYGGGGGGGGLGVSMSSVSDAATFQVTAGAGGGGGSGAGSAGGAGGSLGNGVI